jgi:hypothetical protein
MHKMAMWIVLVLCPATTLLAADNTVQRYVELRDGSVLRLQVVDESWKVAVVRAEGKIMEANVRLAEIEQMTFTPERVFEKKKAMLETMLKLGSEEFDEREKAQEELIKMGSAIRPDLELLKDRFSDLETRTRLGNILDKLPMEKETAAAASFPFDVFQGKETLWGDAGDNGINVKLDGKTVHLARKDLAGVSAKAPETSLMQVGGGAFRQLGADDYPKGCIEEGFETAPDGRKLKVGENVEKVFIKKGFTLATSFKNSFVSVNDFEVKGKTHGLSCATHQPLFHGEITITFCKPGNENIPAAVHYFGTWIAYVEINGTALHAYDMQGKEIGKVAVRKREHDFLGFYSPVPIHSVRVVPNLQIDPDYTLDDFIFTPPQTADFAHPKRCVAQFVEGERLLCGDIQFTPEGVTLKGLAAGLPNFSRSYGSVLYVAPPAKKETTDKPLPAVLLQLQDGSILLGNKSTGDKAAPVFARKPDVLKESDSIVGLWGSLHPRPVWPAEAPAIARIEEGKPITWIPITKVKVEPEQISYDQSTPDVKTMTQTYFQTPPLLLKKATAVEVGNWRIRTVQGEELIVAAPGGVPAITGSLLEELKLKWDGKEIKLAVDEITSLLRAVKP